MANLLPLVPLLLDLLSKKKGAPVPADPVTPDGISAIDREQEVEIDDLKAAVLDLREAMVAMATRMRELDDRLEGLEGKPL